MHSIHLSLKLYEHYNLKRANDNLQIQQIDNMAYPRRKNWDNFANNTHEDIERNLFLFLFILSFETPVFNHF